MNKTATKQKMACEIGIEENFYVKSGSIANIMGKENPDRLVHCKMVEKLSGKYAGVAEILENGIKFNPLTSELVYVS